MNDYESPIHIIYGQMQTQLEGDILKAVLSYGINVDKEELLKALQYDRDQYEKGYEDGRASLRPKGEWIGEADGYADGELVYDVWYCSECDYCVDDGIDDPDLLPNFCPNCGADMRGEKDERKAD